MQGQTTLIEKPSIEAAQFDKFVREFYSEGSKYRGQRLGQAFYNEFDLHKVSDQASLQNLYERSGKEAENLIRSIFGFT